MELSSLGSSSREKPSRDSENEQIRILLERQKEQILADCRAEIQKHEFQADYDRRSILKLNGIIESQRSEINDALAGDEQLRRDQQLLHDQLSRTKSGSLWSSYEKSQWDGRIEAISRVYIRWIFRGEDWSKIETLSLNSQPRFRNYRMMLIVWMIRETLKMLNQYAVDKLTFPVNQRFPTFSRSRRNAEPLSGNAEPQRQAAKYLGHAWYIGETLLQIQRRLLQHLIRKSPILGVLMRQNIHHRMWWVKAKHQTQLWIRDASQDRQPEIHSTLVREDSQRVMEQTNDDCRFRIFILVNSL